VAPVPAADGSLVVPHGEWYAFTLHPRVEGRAFPWGPYEDDAHRRAVLALLVELHGVPGCRDAVGTDTLTVPLADELRAVLDDPGPTWDSGPYAAEAWRLVTERGHVVRDLLDRHRSLTGVADPARFVITHGEPHRANTVVTDDGVLLVDWDTVLLAPPERDLWRMVGEDAGVAATYQQRTGTTLDERLLAAYRLGWDLADVALCVRDLRAAHTDTPDTRISWEALHAAVGDAHPTRDRWPGGHPPRTQPDG
jgi:spectinomycin phosphotransferase/16S rRNA (guanine(1405)-N(7))-methyltransferase